MNLICLLSYSFYLLVTLLLLIFSFRSFKCDYKRVAFKALLFSLLLISLFFLLRAQLLFHSVSSGIFLLVFIALFIPLPEYKNAFQFGEKRCDERDISFSRFRLEPETENYCNYYEKSTDKEEIDKRTRALPGLLGEESKFYHRLNVAATGASFFLLSHLRDSVDGSVANVKHYSPSEIIDYLRSLSKKYGVSCFGTTSIKPKHYYSHIGRGEGEYGSEIPVTHRYAIVLGTEMKPGLTGSAPLSPEVVEVGRRYVDCGVRAVETAAIIRSLGYSATAHIDGTYKVVVPLIALDAKLGGFGWSNLLLTGKFGPRVRYSVVTTDMEIPREESESQDFLAFCNICRKCALNCPSRAINPDRLEKLNADRCFMYWNSVGTDCGRCIAVCPMGHPWGFLKSLALRSITAAWLLKMLDDLFYGKKPRSLPLPGWMEI